MNTLELPSPTVMSAPARAAEITAILAAAIVRSQLAPSNGPRKVVLGFLPEQRVHTTPYLQETLR